MNKYGYLDAEKLQADTLQPMKLDYQVENQNEGIAPYFRVEVSKEPCASGPSETDHDLYSDGLKIYTTIDSRMQKYAESAVAEHMKLQQKWFEQQWKGQQPWRDENGRVIPNFLNSSIKRTGRYRSLTNRFPNQPDSVKYYLNKKYKMKVFSWTSPNNEKEVTMSPMDSLAYYKRLLRAGFMAMNPLNGRVKAWVGGINYKYIKYDHVKQGKRQPGSTFKPFVYVAAIDQGYSPCYQRPDVATTFPAEAGRPAYTPRNFEGTFSGRTFTLRQALARSMNSITAWLVQKLGPETVVSYAKRLGITSPIEAVPAVGFGSSDVSIYEMAGAYSTFVNKGIWTSPVMVTRIEDKNGNVLREFVPQTREALSEETAYLMTYMLRGATEERGGTSIILKTGFKFPYEIGRQNRYHQQLLRRLVYGPHARPGVRYVGGWRRPEHSLPQWLLRPGFAHGAAHLWPVHEEGLRRQEPRHKHRPLPQTGQSHHRNRLLALLRWPRWPARHYSEQRKAQPGKAGRPPGRGYLGSCILR